MAERTLLFFSAAKHLLMWRKTEVVGGSKATRASVASVPDAPLLCYVTTEKLDSRLIPKSEVDIIKYDSPMGLS